jgi:hypothetical protein
MVYFARFSLPGGQIEVSTVGIFCMPIRGAVLRFPKGKINMVVPRGAGIFPQ